MPNVEKLRVNYYVGAMLAQGGEAKLDDSKIIFSPTSAIDRAMGAKDVEIPFDRILGIEYKGELTRQFNLKTKERTHKFEGSQAKDLAKNIEQVLKDKGLKVHYERKTEAVAANLKPISSTVSICAQCMRTMKSEYAFCPYCATSVKNVCSSCNHAIEEDWVVCAYCGGPINRGN